MQGVQVGRHPNPEHRKPRHLKSAEPKLRNQPTKRLKTELRWQRRAGNKYVDDIHPLGRLLQHLVNRRSCHTCTNDSSCLLPCYGLQRSSLLDFQRQIGTLQDLHRFCRHHCSNRGRVLQLEIVTDLLHGHPFDTFVLVNVFDQAFEQQEAVGVSADLAVCQPSKER